MTHKLQEVEDAHIIAELRQRVASLEVQIQEFVTTGQLNDNEKICICISKCLVHQSHLPTLVMMMYVFIEVLV